MVFWAPTELKSNAVLMSPGNLSVAQDQLSRFSGDRDNNTATFVAVVVFTRPDAKSHKWIRCTKARSKQPRSQVTISGTERILVKHKHGVSGGRGCGMEEAEGTVQVKLTFFFSFFTEIF